MYRATTLLLLATMLFTIFVNVQRCHADCGVAQPHLHPLELTSPSSNHSRCGHCHGERSKSALPAKVNLVLTSPAQQDVDDLVTLAELLTTPTEDSRLKTKHATPLFDGAAWSHVGFKHEQTPLCQHALRDTLPMRAPLFLRYGVLLI